MADLFTHVLAGFVIAVVLSWRLSWITPPLVVVCMVGAAIPDLNRIRLILPNEVVEATLGIPWEWGVVHRAGGALPVVVLFTLLVSREQMRAVFVMLCIGVASHFLLDYGLWQASGRTSLLLWPFLDLYLDVGGFYRSSERWPAVVAIIVSGAVLLIDRRRKASVGPSER